MIKSEELRLGNYVLHKTGVRILTVRCTWEHFSLLAKGGEKDFFPVLLSPKVLESCGFAENKKYAYAQPDTDSQKSNQIIKLKLYSVNGLQGRTYRTPAANISNRCTTP